MSRFSVPGFASATGATAEGYAQIEKAVGSVPNTFNAALKTSLRRKLLACVALAILAGGVSAMVDAQSAAARELPMQSIVNGQRLQPRDDDLRAIHHPDVTASQAAEIDRLYRELLHCIADQCPARGN
jgi:hypothetical protein